MDETGDEMIETSETTVTTILPSRKTNSQQTVTYHSTQLGAGQSLQTGSTPMSVTVAQSQPLPAPYSPNQVTPSIEQAGYQRGGSETITSASAPAGNQGNNVVYINNAQSL